jgi:hypothetical protein
MGNQSQIFNCGEHGTHLFLAISSVLLQKRLYDESLSRAAPRT